MVFATRHRSVRRLLQRTSHRAAALTAVASVRTAAGTAFPKEDEEQEAEEGTHNAHQKEPPGAIVTTRTQRRWAAAAPPQLACCWSPSAAVNTTTAMTRMILVPPPPQQQQGHCFSSASSSLSSSPPRRTKNGLGLITSNRMYLLLGDDEKEQDASSSSPSSSLIVTPLTHVISSITDDSTKTQEEVGNVDLVRSSSTTSPPPTPTVDALVQAIDERYESLQHFVGGMGESDGGVWFTPPFAKDLLDSSTRWVDLMRSVMQRVKEKRHGVPFGLYTSGNWKSNDKDDDDDKDEDAVLSLLTQELDMVEITLGASNPMEYAKLVGGSADEASRAFGRVCHVLATVSETGTTDLQVGIMASSSSSSSSSSAKDAIDLAHSLGAVRVVLYQP